MEFQVKTQVAGYAPRWESAEAADVLAAIRTAKRAVQQQAQVKIAVYTAEFQPLLLVEKRQGRWRTTSLT